MEKTPESVAAEIAALKHSLMEVGDAVDKYAQIATQNVGNKDSTASGEVSESHRALFLKTSKLLTTVRGPVDMVISNFENSVHTGCLRVVMEMGIFQELPMDGPSATAASLSEKLGVEKDLLVRLMRNLTTTGPFAEVGKEEYAHTLYSQIYLVPTLTGLFKAMVDEFVPSNAKMYAFFREHGFKSPTSDLINPYCFAHQTGDKTMWEYLNQYPERNTALNDAQKANGEANSLDGALIYYIRHCLHDWPDKDCVRILEQIASAIKPGTSRLVISENILPESNVDLESAWLDIAMVGISGLERTKPQWERILDEAGFKLHKTYQAPGTCFAAIEAYLK